MSSAPTIPEFVRGDATGQAIPAHPGALRDRPEEQLTALLHAYGSLEVDNRIARVTRFESFLGGNSGQKLVLSVEYERPEPDLHSELFVKFSREFSDPFRDRRRYEFEGEIKLAQLSHLPGFPVSVAKPYFADFNHETGTGVLITERIAYGSGAIEPLHPKCMDHLLADPLEYYRETVSALARLAAAQHTGRISPDLERLFPFDAEAAAADLPIGYNASELRDKVIAYRKFVGAAPQLFPASLAAPEFFARMERDVVRFQEHEAKVRRFLHADPRFIALCHWNSNIDNAWFWRDESGGLHCGLLDWGMVRQMNVAYGLWGGLSAADGDFLARHLGSLLAHFTTELEAHGGPHVDPDELALHFDLSLAMLGLALMMDTPALITTRLPSIRTASAPLDPLLVEDKVVHGFLHVSTNFLSLWESRDLGASLARMLEMPQPR
ncbi:MAG: hypothetical protein P8J20_00160 [Novosphingobium sp.]|nr:hypothetical protein [Novosphingobium sp.]